ncbi:RTA1 like protein-domain-containing protein [Lyophyllum atratum]|nr:RTA1 like protein-domain-containing protein [Lyophyllum atratum]
MAGGGYVDPNFPNPGGPKDIPVIVYGYTPNFALSLLGVILFAILTVVHGWRVFRPRWSLWLLPLPISTALEVAGYIPRLLSSKVSPYNIIFFVCQYFFIVVAPVILAAGIYVTLSRMLALVGHSYSPIFSPRTILITFICCDVIATATQVIGAAMIGQAESNYKDSTIPNHILLAGLAFQVFAFAIFLALYSLFMAKTREVRRQYKGLRWFSWVLMLASVLVWVRTIFRLIETAQGVYGYLSSREIFFGVLEFAPIVVAIGVLAVWHPAQYVEPAPDSVEKHPEVEMTNV